MIIVSLYKGPSDKKLINAQLYRVSHLSNFLPKTASGVPLGVSSTTVTENEIKLIPRVLQELKSLKEEAILQHNLDIPIKVRFLLEQAIMQHNKAISNTIEPLIIKVWKDKYLSHGENQSNSIIVLAYLSEEIVPIEWEHGDRNNNSDCLARCFPVKAAYDTLKYIQKTAGVPVKLLFDNEVSQDVKDLFTEIIDTYNKSLEPKENK